MSDLTEFLRKWNANEHACKDGCPTHGRVVCACLRRCRPCEFEGLRLLALPYADHPSYVEVWRP